MRTLTTVSVLFLLLLTACGEVTPLMEEEYSYENEPLTVEESYTANGLADFVPDLDLDGVRFSPDMLEVVERQNNDPPMDPPVEVVPEPVPERNRAQVLADRPFCWDYPPNVEYMLDYGFPNCQPDPEVEHVCQVHFEAIYPQQIFDSYWANHGQDFPEEWSFLLDPMDPRGSSLILLAYTTGCTEDVRITRINLRHDGPILRRRDGDERPQDRSEWTCAENKRIFYPTSQMVFLEGRRLFDLLIMNDDGRMIQSAPGIIHPGYAWPQFFSSRQSDLDGSGPSAYQHQVCDQVGCDQDIRYIPFDVGPNKVQLVAALPAEVCAHEAPDAANQLRAVSYEYIVGGGALQRSQIPVNDQPVGLPFSYPIELHREAVISGVPRDVGFTVRHPRLGTLLN